MVVVVVGAAVVVVGAVVGATVVTVGSDPAAPSCEAAVADGEAAVTVSDTTGASESRSPTMLHPTAMAAATKMARRTSRESIFIKKEN